VKEKKRILKVLVLVKIWSFFKKNTQKCEFSLLFFWPHPFFGRKQTNCQKITSGIPNDQHVGQKQFHDILIGIGGGNPKC
jgi:hypothetical protein